MKRRKEDLKRIQSNPKAKDVRFGCEAIHATLLGRPCDFFFADEVDPQVESSLRSLKTNTIFALAYFGLMYVLRSDPRVPGFLVSRLVRALFLSENEFKNGFELFLAGCQMIVDTKGEVLASFIPNYAKKKNINREPLRAASGKITEILHFFCLSRSFLKGPSPKGFLEWTDITFLLTRYEKNPVGFPKEDPPSWIVGTVHYPPTPEDFVELTAELDGEVEEVFDCLDLYKKFLTTPLRDYIYGTDGELRDHITMVKCAIVKKIGLKNVDVAREKKKIEDLSSILKKNPLDRTALMSRCNAYATIGLFFDAIEDCYTQIDHFQDREESFMQMIHVEVCMGSYEKALNCCRGGLLPSNFPSSSELKYLQEVVTRLNSSKMEKLGVFCCPEFYFRRANYQKLLLDLGNKQGVSHKTSEGILDIPPRKVEDCQLEETVLTKGWERVGERSVGKKIVGVVCSPCIVGSGSGIEVMFCDEEGSQVFLVFDSFEGVDRCVFIFLFFFCFFLFLFFFFCFFLFFFFCFFLFLFFSFFLFFFFSFFLFFFFSFFLD